MLIEQAIFTSADTSRAKGYQLVATSPGVADVDARHLSGWGPSHDSLAEFCVPPVSVNFHVLPSGACCVSKTQTAGPEYSGRGTRVYTSCLIAPPELSARFANNPFALLRAAAAKGLPKIHNAPPAHLAPFQLPGRAAAVDEGLIARLAEQLGARRLAWLMQSVLEGPPVFMAGAPKPDGAIAGVLHCLPPRARTEISFSTGLRFSSRRSFRLLAVHPANRELQRLAHEHSALLVDLESEPPRDFRPTGWAAYLADLVSTGGLPLLADQLGDPGNDLPLERLAELGDRFRRELRTPITRNRDRSAGEQERPPVPAPLEQAEAGGARLSGGELFELLDAAAPPERPFEPLGAGTQRLAHAPHEARNTNGPLPASPTSILAAENPEVIERLERLDDAVFSAIDGDPKALSRVAELWPALVEELGTDQIEESREQYVRYCLSLWERCLGDGLRDPGRAIASLQVLSTLFGGAGSA